MGLRTPEFHILLAIEAGERHGYAMMQHAERVTAGAVRLGPGTLYDAIARLEGRGLLAEAGRPPREEDHPQRRYYELTARGRSELLAELERLESLAAYAREAVRKATDGGGSEG